MTDPQLVARLEGVPFPDGTIADVDLVCSERPQDEARTFAAMVFLRDAGGLFAAVYSIRRAQWGPPGGWREPGETVATNAVREVAEETGIRLTEASLRPVAYEQYRPHVGGGLWRPGHDLLQCYAADLEASGPPLVDSMGDTSAQEWVTYAELERRCGQLFWWPITEALFRPDQPTAPAPG